jgi:hypothetical protein
MSTKIYDAEAQILTIAYAKDVGLDERGRVAWFDVRERSRGEAGLAPVLVYSVVAPSYSQYVRRLVDARSSIPVTQFLAMAWSKENALGMPNVLDAKPSLLKADRGYVAWVSSQGIVLRPPTVIQSVTAFERAAIDVSFAMTWGLDHPKGPRPLHLANTSIREYDEFSLSNPSLRPAMEEATYSAWAARPKRYFEGQSLEADWNVAAVDERTTARPNPDLAVHDYRDSGPLVDGIQEVLAMWPGGRGAVMRRLEIDSHDVDFWAAGRARLASADFARLRQLLRIEPEDFDEGDLWRMAGGYLLIATTAKQTIAAYDELAHGGDLQYAFEIVGPHGELPPLRFLVFEPLGGLATIILFERGGPAEKVLLGQKHLINLGEAVRASPAVWESVAMIVENRERFKTPEKVGAAFAAQHAEWLEPLGRWP